jgi:hypothetical protein
VDSILEVRGLEKSYEGFALRGVRPPPRGYIMAHRSERGRQTTIIRLSCLARPDRGEIRALGLTSALTGPLRGRASASCTRRRPSTFT